MCQGQASIQVIAQIPPPPAGQNPELQIQDTLKDAS
jgi:hypothetical protein